MHKFATVLFFYQQVLDHLKIISIHWNEFVSKMEKKNESIKDKEKPSLPEATNHPIDLSAAKIRPNIRWQN